MPENPKVKEAINCLLQMFKEENLEKVARAVFRGNEIPSDKWSFCNRFIMFMHGTEDARGFKQWQQVGRNVKKGSRAFYILGPVFKIITIKVINPDTKEETLEKRQIIAGFKAIPVFRLEDTEGAPIITQQYELKIPCEFNGIITELGLNIKPISFDGATYGFYRLGTRDIRLASPAIEVFLHELGHAVDDRLNGLKPGQRADQEVSAEFSAAVIGHLMGYRIPLGSVREYIENYSFKELLSSLARIEKIVSYVIERTKAVGVTQPAVCVA